MLLWFQMIKMIISMLTSVFSIFHDLITFYVNFVTFFITFLIYQENNLLSHKIKYLFISNLKYNIYTKIFMNACY